MSVYHFTFTEVAKRWPSEVPDSARVEVRDDRLLGVSLAGSHSSCYALAEVADLRALHAWLGETLAEIDPQPADPKGT